MKEAKPLTVRDIAWGVFWGTLPTAAIFGFVAYMALKDSGVIS